MNLASQFPVDQLVSCVVPVYNVESFLPQCITSILEQSYNNLELILVDDGSQDNSGSICDDFAVKDSRIRVIHQNNKGVSAARNAGMDAAKGDYLCFVDGDDYVMKDYISYLVGLIRQYHVAIVVQLNRMPDYDPVNRGKKNEVVFTGEKATEMLLCYRCPEAVWGKMYRRDFLETNEIRFFENIAVGKGFNFNCLAYQAADKIVFTQWRSYFYRKNNPTSATTRCDAAKWENGLYAIDVIKDNLKLNSKEILSAWKYAYWRTHADAYDLIVLSHSEKQCPEMYARCLNVTKAEALHALAVPVSLQNKLRAIIMRVYPRAIPWAMLQRRKFHKAEVETQG